MPVNPYESPPSDDPDSLDAAEPTVEARLIGLPAGGLIATAVLSIVALLCCRSLHCSPGLFTQAGMKISPAASKKLEINDFNKRREAGDEYTDCWAGGV